MDSDSVCEVNVEDQYSITKDPFKNMFEPAAAVAVFNRY